MNPVLRYIQGYPEHIVTPVTQMVESGRLQPWFKQRYPDKPYNSISIIGAVQKAAGVPGADVGKPNFDEGAKCEWTTFCCHPKYDSPAGEAWRDAFWDLYFSNEFPSSGVSV